MCLVKDKAFLVPLIDVKFIPFNLRHATRRNSNLMQVACPLSVSSQNGTTMKKKYRPGELVQVEPDDKSDGQENLLPPLRAHFYSRNARASNLSKPSFPLTRSAQPATRTYGLQSQAHCATLLARTRQPAFLSKCCHQNHQCDRKCSFGALI